MHDPFADVPTRSEVVSSGDRQRGPKLEPGFYITRLSITELGLSSPRAGAGGEVKVPKPFSRVSCYVTEGPFATRSVAPMLYLTPGKGQNLHFLRAAAHAITGKPADGQAFTKYAVPVNPTMNVPERMAAFVSWFYEVAADETRLDFMVDYLRVKEWNGKTVVTRMGVEQGRSMRTNEETGESYYPVYNRILGFWPMGDPVHGRSWVVAEEWPRLKAIEASE